MIQETEIKRKLFNGSLTDLVKDRKMKNLELIRLVDDQEHSA